MTHVYLGIWPVAPTPFHNDGTLDLDGMKRVLDCLIDQSADGSRRPGLHGRARVYR